MATERQKQQGFSLIELAILITVLSLVMAASVGWLFPASYEESEKIRITRERLKTLRQSMHGYRVLFERLPCAARHDVADDNINFGAENCSNTYGSNLNRGMVPVRTLGLSPDYAYDGWGRRFTYHVAEAICGLDASGYPTNCSSLRYEQPVGTNYLTVNSFNRANLGGSSDPDSAGEWLAIATNVAYVILSHGMNGDGAWMPSGAQRDIGAVNNRQDENSDADRIYYTSPYDAAFDDIVLFETTEQIERYTVDFEEYTLTPTDCQEIYGYIGAMTPAEATTMDTEFDNFFGYYTNANAGILELAWHMQWTCLALYPDDYLSNLHRCPGYDDAKPPSSPVIPARTFQPVHGAEATAAHRTALQNQGNNFGQCICQSNSTFNTTTGECECPGVLTWNEGAGACL